MEFFLLVGVLAELEVEWRSAIAPEASRDPFSEGWHELKEEWFADHFQSRWANALSGD